MSDRFTLPPPGLLRTEIINLGPVIEPGFSDARNWSEFLPAVETKAVYVESREVALTEDVARRAVDMALTADGVVRELDGKRYAIMSVGLKSLDRQTEYPWVILYDYTDDRVVEATVDVAGGKVLDVTAARYQPPLTSSEQSHAIELVRRNGQLAAAGIAVETGAGLIVEEVNFRSPRYGHRLVDLRFGPEDRRAPTAFAIVDLSAQDVVSTGLAPRGPS
jgi:hypothetical protein